LIVAFAATNVAEWGYVTALAVDALRRSGALAVGIVGLRLFLASLSSIFSTAVLQKRKPGHLLVEIPAGRAALVAVSAGLAASGSPIAPLLILLGLDAILSAPYRPAQSAILPSLCRNPRSLVAASAGLSTVKTLSQSLGAVAGGVALALTTPAVVFCGSAAVFLAGAAVALPFRARGSMGTRGGSIGIVDLTRDTLAVVRNPHVATILVVSGLRTFVRGMWLAIAVIASLRLLHAGSAGVGLLMLAGGIGSVIAAPVSSRLVAQSRIGTPAALSLAACGVPLALIAGIPVFDLALALIAAWGIGMAVADVATSSLLNRLLGTPALPRVTSTIEAAKLALEGLGAFLAPVLITVVGIRATLLLAALPLPLVVVSSWRSLHRVDASAGERALLLEMLHAVPCLAPLDMASLDTLIGRLTPMYIPAAGIDIVRQGDPGDRFYIVEEGQAEVLVDGFTVAVLGRGSGFGERALLRNVTRTATVRSRGPMQLFVLPRQDFLDAVTGQEGDFSEPAVVADSPSRSDWDHRALARVLSGVAAFSHLDSDELMSLAKEGNVASWTEGASIIRQGEKGDEYFVLLEGRAAVAVNGAQVTELLPGDPFGEIALLHRVPRRADVVAISPAVTMSLDRESFSPALLGRFLAG
jgi:CRP-like cAMP-binding protein